MSLYDILGVKPNSTIESIRKAFRKKAKIVHPDINNGEGHEDFLKLQKALIVLSNEETRKIYDETGEYEDPFRKTSVPTLDQNVMGILDGIIHGLMEQGLFPQETFLKNAINVAKQINSKIFNEVERETLMLSRLEFYQSTIKKEEKEEDFLLLAIEAKKRELDRKLEELNERLKASNKVVDLLKGYKENEINWYPDYIFFKGF